eukprot:3754082-Pleurochrysis_carterae.AAC.3
MKSSQLDHRQYSGRPAVSKSPAGLQPAALTRCSTAPLQGPGVWQLPLRRTVHGHETIYQRSAAAVVEVSLSGLHYTTVSHALAAIMHVDMTGVTQR